MSESPGRMPSSEAQAAKLRGILKSAVTAIITIDDRGIIESVNPATERLFGYNVAELVGHNVNVLMPEPYRTEHDGYLSNYLEQAPRRSSALVVRSAAGAKMEQRSRFTCS